MHYYQLMHNSHIGKHIMQLRKPLKMNSLSRFFISIISI